MEGEIERLSIGLGDGELHFFAVGQLSRPRCSITGIGHRNLYTKVLIARALVASHIQKVVTRGAAATLVDSVIIIDVIKIDAGVGRCSCLLYTSPSPRD